LTPVYWLEQALADVPPDPSWLSRAERDRAAAFRVPKRRQDWLLGRWTAKRALLSVPAIAEPTPGDRRTGGPDHEALARAEIRAAASGVPEPFWDGSPLPWSLSLSHSGGRAVSALARAGAALGCDLEEIAPRSPGFLEEAFTGEERERVAASAEPDLASALCWSAKESVMKALGEGLRLPLLDFAVEGRPLGGAATRGDFGSPLVPGWRPIRVRRLSTATWFTGFWRRGNGRVVTVVAVPPPGPPIPLL
jgi:4'-phosphopantetheinyl transferase